MERARKCARGRAPAPAGNLEHVPTKLTRKRTARAALRVAKSAIFCAAMASLVQISVGCGPAQKQSDVELAVFEEQSGPVRFDGSYEQVLQMRTSTGPYRLVSGDLLELQMPAVARLMPNRDGDDTEPYRCRIDSAGRIVLPIVGDLVVVGRTLAKVEAAIASLYYPKYVRQEPSIVASVSDYHLSSVSIMGAAEAPGIYELRSNEMTLIAALMKAGGITQDCATTIQIHGCQSDKKRSLTVPVLVGNIPVRDEELVEGDTVIVERSEVQNVSVVGLVKKPGMFPWGDAKGRHTVMDVLAFAGGVNDLADPQYARVYRQDSAGEVISALVRLDGASSAGTGELYLKPGDIVVVEQTPRTRTRLLLAQIIRMGFGVNAGASVGP